MAFIDKKDPVVLNIKLTSKGRELLSKGALKFNYFAVGDSEIDYNFISETGIDPFFSNILRPADKNPSILSFIPQSSGGDPYNLISNVPSTPTIITNTVQPLGFFTTSNNITSFITDTDHVKQPDLMVYVGGVYGGKELELYKAPTYLGNVNEPTVGDYLLIKWINSNSFGSTTGYTVNDSLPTPYLVYKLKSVTGSLGNSDHVTVTVDRELPNFSGISGTSIVAGAIVFYNYINYSGDTLIYSDYSSEYVDDAMLAFMQNCQCPTIKYPFWNLSIVFTENIIGVDPTKNKWYAQYNSSTYAGFISYIQNQSPIYKKLGIIHYTNSSPSNTYAEELYTNTPILTLPTIMWHKAKSNKMGLTLGVKGDVKILSGATKSLNTSYYDLYDINDVDRNYPVGKVFTDLKLFVIEDQELLFAMSYKSNRSWTLPNYKFGINDNINIGCVDCYLNSFIPEISIIPPSTYTSTDGEINITNIRNIGDVLAEVYYSGATTYYKVFEKHYYVNINDFNYEEFTPDTIINIPDLKITENNDKYIIKIYDFGAPNCNFTSGVTISIPSNILDIISLSATQSGLNSDFEITQINNNPTNIIVYNNLNNLGTPYGTFHIGISDFNNPFIYTWYNTDTDISDLSFRSPYIVTLADFTGSTSLLTNMVSSVSKLYVAVGNPLNSSFSIGQSSDINGKYILISNYLTSIVNNINPIVGKIQFTAYPSGSYPTRWEELPAGSSEGTTKKFYTNSTTTGNYIIEVREVWNNVEIFKVTNSINIT